jgi:hypothetical protein
MHVIGTIAVALSLGTALAVLAWIALGLMPE